MLAGFLLHVCGAGQSRTLWFNLHDAVTCKGRVGQQDILYVAYCRVTGLALAALQHPSGLMPLHLVSACALVDILPLSHVVAAGTQVKPCVGVA